MGRVTVGGGGSLMSGIGDASGMGGSGFES